MPKKCPLLKKPCIEHDCMWWQHVIGHHPQSGTPMDHHNCAIVWANILQIEGNKEVRSGAAATESFRNEMVRGLTGLKQLAVQRARGLIGHAD